MINILISKYNVLIILLFIATGCIHTSQEPYAIEKTATAPSAMVVTAHPLATKIGVQILEAGGNAVDAAIAVQFALAVVYPVAGNIGGGGFMLIRQSNGEAMALDYREKAPVAASRDMYLDSAGQIIDGLSTLGHRSNGVPGTVDGMITAHERYGSMAFRDLVEPSIALARNGILLTSNEAEELNLARSALVSVNQSAAPFVQSEAWQTDDLLVQSDLAHTLERIANACRDGFYRGETARLLIEDQQSGGGIITQQDLDDYHAVWRNPLRGWFRDHEVLSMPPPSSGGIALMQLLEGIEDQPLDSTDVLSVSTIHRMAEIMRRVYADRAAYLGDPDHVEVPVDHLLDSLYIRSRMQTIRTDSVTPSGQVQEGNWDMHESDQTTHFSIVDKQGMAVSVTTTLNLEFGSKVIVQGAGFIMNNEMDDFSAKPGVPNSFGLIGSTANAIAPGKRMLSSMTPTMVVDHGQTRLVVGSPGGSKIITTVFQIIFHSMELGIPLTDAVALPRMHHQWRPDTLFVEADRFHPDTLMRLRALGHHVIERSPIGRVDAIWIEANGDRTGAADPRGDDHAAGY
ncbi:MAG: gamma-glutamyltransferase [Saprospiraceae bacterium]|nr:gamma-glutamyltransferase [Saprospiraceae bacterium]